MWEIMDFKNIVAEKCQLGALVGLNCRKCVIIHGMENIKNEFWTGIFDSLLSVTMTVLIVSHNDSTYSQSQ
jgi:hypothetical protein